MPATTIWEEMTRSEQRLLIRLFGCGSLRNQNPKAIEGLYRHGLIDNKGALSPQGMMVFAGALHQQRAEAQRRTGLA
jgi:hypothetical protein